MTSADTPYRRGSAAARSWRIFRVWRRGRPFWGGLLTVLSGVVFFVSDHLTIGNVKISFGPQEFLGWVIPLILVLCGVLMMVTPGHRIFYGVLASAVSVGGLIGLNLGGFFVGMLLGMVGGALGASWTPVELPPAAPSAADGPDIDAGAHEPEEYQPETYDGTTYDGTTYEGTTYQGASYEGVHHEPAPGGDAGPPSRGPLTDTLPTSTTSPLGVPPVGADDPGTDGGPLPRRSPRGLVVILLVLTLGTVGLTVARIQSPAAAAPPTCGAAAAPALRTAPTGKATTPSPAGAAAAKAPVAPAPVAGTSAATGAPAVSESPSASSSQAPTTVLGAIGGLVTGVLNAIGSLFDPGTDPSASPSPSTPASPSAPPSVTPPTAAPSPTPVRPPTAAPKPTTRRTAPPSPSPTCTALRPLAAPASQTRAAVNPAQQITANLTQILLTFDGVTDVPTVSGSIQVLQFSFDSSASTPFELRVPVGVHTLDYTSSQLTVAGHVRFYTSRLDGKLLGLPVTFTPASPPPLPQGLPIPLPITFTDVTLTLVLVHADVLTAPNLSITGA